MIVRVTPQIKAAIQLYLADEFARTRERVTEGDVIERLFRDAAPDYLGRATKLHGGSEPLSRRAKKTVNDGDETPTPDR